MKQKACGVHHIGMSSRHFDDTVRLYQEGLGFTIKPTWGKGQRVYMMDMGDGSCVEVFEEKEEDLPAVGRWMHLALNTRDIHESYRRALAAGAQPKLPPTFADIVEATPRQVNMWFAYVTGFDGEEIEFIQEEPSGSKPTPSERARP
jgi:glyoxylase I family protein